MEFIELSGDELLHLLHEDEYEPGQLRSLEKVVQRDGRVRVNRHGDIEILQEGDWEVIGGLLGDFAHRIQKKTGRDWQSEDS